MKTLLITAFVIVLAVNCECQMWSVAVPNRSLYSVTVDPTDPQIIYVGNVARTFLKSSDGGITWDERLIGEGGGASEISLLQVNPMKPNILYAGGSGFTGMDRSTDYGETWTNVLHSNDGSRFELGGSGAAAFNPINADTMFAIRFDNGAIYRSNDAGATWDSISTLPGLRTSDRLRAITVCPDSANVLLASGRYAYVYRSSDGGLTWTITTGIGLQPDMDMANFAWSKSVPGTVYAVAGYSLWDNPGNGGMFLSTDYGQTWARYRFTDTSLYAVMVNSTPHGDEIYVGGNQVDYPPDDGHIKGDSIVLRVSAEDSSVKDISDVPWTENEVGVVGTNVWGFAVTERDGYPVLLMASTGGLFISNEITGIEEQSMMKSPMNVEIRTLPDALDVVLSAPPGQCSYRVVDLQGRTVVNGEFNGSAKQISIPLAGSERGCYIVQLFTMNGNASKLFIR